MIDVELESLPALMALVDERLRAGWVLNKATDPKGGLLGFAAFDYSKPRPDREDEYLFVRRSKLSTGQFDEWAKVPDCLPVTEPDPDANARIDAMLEGTDDDSDDEPEPTESPETLAALWADGLEADGRAMANELIEGERDAKANQALLPSTKQMAAWCAVVEQGIRDAGLDWTRHSPGGSPFTFRWGTASTAKNHGAVEVGTDHLGVTFTAGTRHGITWSIEAASRILWADPEFDAEHVREHVKAVFDVFDRIPECRCERHLSRRGVPTPSGRRLK